MEAVNQTISSCETLAFPGGVSRWGHQPRDISPLQIDVSTSRIQYNVYARSFCSDPDRDHSIMFTIIRYYAKRRHYFCSPSRIRPPQRVSLCARVIINTIGRGTPCGNRSDHKRDTGFMGKWDLHLPRVFVAYCYWVLK